MRIMRTEMMIMMMIMAMIMMMIMMMIIKTLIIMIMMMIIDNLVVDYVKRKNADCINALLSPPGTPSPVITIC